MIYPVIEVVVSYKIALDSFAKIKLGKCEKTHMARDTASLSFCQWYYNLYVNVKNYTYC